MLAALAATVAGILGATADRLPETTAPLPAACVAVPVTALGGGLQAGYCP